ncbi:MAG: hypothetical protein JNJ57_17730, partial [Saprospiraceae bacterium]|nr:hypothetical protein [Saprospiraceae bacterium]
IGAKYADQSFKSDSLSNDFFKGYPVGTQTFNAHYFYRYQLDVRSHYLEIPIGLRITPRAYQKQTVVVSGGAAFTFPLSVKFKSSWGTPYQVINNFGLNPPRTVEDGYFPVDKVESKIPNIAVFAGFGFRRLLDNKNQLEYGLQYTWSRDKMTAHLGGVYEGRQEDLMHTRHRIQLMLSYYFQL